MFLLKALVLLANSLRNLIGALFLNCNIHFYFLFISCKSLRACNFPCPPVWAVSNFSFVVKNMKIVTDIYACNAYAWHFQPPRAGVHNNSSPKCVFEFCYLSDYVCEFGLLESDSFKTGRKWYLCFIGVFEIYLLDFRLSGIRLIECVARMILAMWRIRNFYKYEILYRALISIAWGGIWFEL